MAVAEVRTCWYLTYQNAQYSCRRAVATGEPRSVLQPSISFVCNKFTILKAVRNCYWPTDQVATYHENVRLQVLTRRKWRWLYLVKSTNYEASHYVTVSSILPHLVRRSQKYLIRVHYFEEVISSLLPPVLRKRARSTLVPSRLSFAAIISTLASIWATAHAVMDRYLMRMPGFSPMELWDL
jgi:hypothetical protein